MSRTHHPVYAAPRHGTRQADTDRQRAAWCADVDPVLLAQAERELAATLAPDPVLQAPSPPVAAPVAAWWRKGVGA